MIIPKSDIEQFREPESYLKWFNDLIKEANSTPDYKSDSLLHRSVKNECGFKFLYEEIFPLASLLKAKIDEWKDAKFRNVPGNQSFDVELQNNCLDYLEITTTTFDQDEVYRMMVLMKNGHVPAVTKIKRDSKGKPVAISKSPRRHDDVMSEILLKIKNRILAKSEKQYPDKTGLIVDYDDYKYYIKEEDYYGKEGGIFTKKNDYIRFKSLVDETYRIWSKRFDALFIVGPRAEVHFERWK